MHQPPALILAAGRGIRMRPLTDACPKPLLPVLGQPLLDWWLDRLQRDGASRVMVNTAWLGERIERHLRERSGVRIEISAEGRDFGRALETAGAVVRALPWLAPHPGDVFWTVAGDIFAPDFVFEREAALRFIAGGRLAHLWLVPNPAQHPDGDFGLDADGLVLDGAGADGVRHTFMALGLYRRELFELPWCNIAFGNPQGIAEPLAPLLRKAARAGQVSGQLHHGRWSDIGTPGRLQEIEADAANWIPAE